MHLAALVHVAFIKHLLICHLLNFENLTNNITSVDYLVSFQAIKYFSKDVMQKCILTLIKNN